jgi:LPS-assembly protein
MLALLHPLLQGQAVTNQSPPQEYPDAVLLPAPAQGDIIGINADRQAVHGNLTVLDGEVEITYQDRVVRADHIEYDKVSRELTATGHLDIEGGANREHIQASHGTFNLGTETGRFYDVTGSIGLTPVRPGRMRRVYSNEQPFLFSGRVVVKTGPTSYDLYDGSVTSCQLPNPDWFLTSEHFTINDGVAKGSKSTFHLLGLPLLYLPYVTHPTEPGERESGFLIPPVPGYSSTKGITLQEQFYIVLGRSADLTLGASYYSLRGFAQDATFRYKGTGLDFVKFRYTGLLDRLPGTENQGGEDAIASARHDLDASTRVAADVEYLSSYVYREAFTENFNQAVTSDIVSTIYGVHEHRGVETALLADRYQGIKLIQQGTTPQQQVHIFHAPAVLLDTTEHRLGETPVEWSIDSSVSGLKRTQPNFETGGLVERVDLHPQLAIPFAAGQWRLRPAVGFEETAYSRSFQPALTQYPQQENLAALSRSDVELIVGLRAPVLERVFTPNHLHWLLGDKVKHTIEPEATYRLTKGIGNFSHVLRFDALDVVADTNEMEYGVTQRLFRRRSGAKPCAADALPDAPTVSSGGGTTAGVQDSPAPEETEGGLNPDPTLAVGNEIGPDATPDSCQTAELISWRLTQKYFIDPTFGGAVQNGRRNLFDTTLALSGVAFLTEPRNVSPVISRLRFRSSAHTDLEWDFDLDTGARKFTSSNVFVDLHASNGLFGALSYARLDAPGKFFTEGESVADGVTSRVSDFNQLRLLVGFGSPVKPGLSLAGNAGLDLKSLYGETSTTTGTNGLVSSNTVYPALLQYATAQAAYNWNCCGLSIEYRKFELGSVRNEGTYKFNFTLANIATVGNLRRAERLF